MTFVDTNIFLRFLLNDVSNQYRQAKQLFLDGAGGKIKLISSTIVFFEMYWVLRSYYGKNKASLLATLRKILAMNFVVFEERLVLYDAFVLFEKSAFRLEDCYNLVFAKKREVKAFKTFDVKLTRAFEKNP